MVRQQEFAGRPVSVGELSPQAGLTLVELIITVAIVAILATAALPIARFQVKREKERELRRDLWEMRDAIDHYKDAAEKGGMVTKADSICLLYTSRAAMGSRSFSLGAGFTVAACVGLERERGTDPLL